MDGWQYVLFGTHTIHIVRFDPDGVSSREGNEHVPVWNHDIWLIEKDENHTQYADLGSKTSKRIIEMQGDETYCF